MKDPREIVCCVVDYGSFIPLAEKLAETYKEVHYYSPYEQEFLSLDTCVKGDGLDKVCRIDSYLDPDFLKRADLFVFPDRGYSGVQCHLRDDMDKAVWGSFGVCEIEEYRTCFVDLLKELKMPMVPSVKIQGLTKLSAYLHDKKNKWVKVDRYRANRETFRWIDWEHTSRILEKLAMVFGPCKELVGFVVQDDIETDVEIGYDGWSVDGEFPVESYQGYEAKNELYLGAKKKLVELPGEVRYVNSKMAPILREAGYRNFWATEIRVKDGIPYFIDPTARMPGQTGEQLLETCENLADVIWRGAHGELVVPKFKHPFALEATLHYTAGDVNEWHSLNVPKTVDKWVKLYHYCKIGDTYHCVPRESTEVGVVMGVGETVAKAFDHLKKNIDALKNEPVTTDVRAFADLLKKIQVAERKGIEFSKQPLPKPEIAVT